MNISNLSSGNGNNTIDDIDDMFSDEDGEYIKNMFKQKTSELESLSEASTSDSISKILAAIAFNDLTDERLARLEMLLKRRLKECRQRMSDFIVNDMYKVKVQGKEKPFQYSKCGMPYFKDKYGWGAPSNSDTSLMKQGNMFDHYKCTPTSWTNADKNLFICHMKDITSKLKQKELSKKTKNTKLHATVIEREYKTDSMDLSDLSINKEYDWEDIANKLEYKHSAQEYKSMWKLCLSPLNNNSEWTEIEQTMLKTIAFKYKEQDWDKIAKDLGTKRTGYQCFVYYVTNFINSSNTRKWHEDESKFLDRIVRLCTDSDGASWPRIAACMANGTAKEVYTRLRRNKVVIKGRFMPEEDEVLLTCIKLFGRNYTLISKYLERSESQIRKRYQLLMQNQSIEWTIAEDKVILQLYNEGFDMDSKELKYYFPGRNLPDIRKRVTTIVKWLKTGNFIDVTIAPRRRKTPLIRGSKPADSLVTALQKLNEKLKTQIAEENTKVIFTNNDTHIMKFIIEEMFEETIPNENTVSLNVPEKNVSNNVQIFQIVLKVKLDKTKIDTSLYSQYYNENVKIIITQNKIRSYSKKNKDTNVESGYNQSLMPNVWGQKIETESKFVLPPNYNTLLGCKTLLYSFHNCVTNCNKSIHNLRKNNIILDGQYNILNKRLKLLFLWPLRLSNTSHTTIKINN